MMHSHVLELWLNNQRTAPGDDTTEMVPGVPERQPVEFRSVPPPGCTLKLALVGPLHTLTLDAFMRPGDPAWRWQWHPQNAVGRFTAVLAATCAGSTVEEVRVPFEVLPDKLSQQHYTNLLDDMQRTAQALVYGLAQSSAGAALLRTPDPTQQRHLLEAFGLLYEERIATLERLVAQIARHPHTTLRPHTEHIPPGQARDWSQMARAGRYDIAGATVPQTRSIPTTDTYENRLLKHVLDEHWRRARAVGRAAEALTMGSSGRMAHAGHTLATHSDDMARRLQRLRALPFLADLKPPTALRGPSHLMRRNTPYRHVYRLWQEMRRSPLLRVESPLLHLPLHNLPYLYECWCALQVAHVLLELPDAVVHAQNLFAAARPVPGTSGAPDAFAYRLVLNEDTPLLAIEWQGIQVRLRYHPRYHPRASDAHTLVSLDSHTHIPDLALEWQQAESPPTVVVLDAKYRLDTGGSVPTDALADAYTYLGGIGGPAGQRVVCGAALLFPGAGEAEHHISGVSAIPLLPGAAESLRTWLWHMLHAAGDSTAPR